MELFTILDLPSTFSPAILPVVLHIKDGKGVDLLLVENTAA